MSRCYKLINREKTIREVKEYLKTSKNHSWRACLVCGEKEIIQVRKALFTCCNCNQEFISTEKDMRE